jgi:hypothetical protein
LTRSQSDKEKMVASVVFGFFEAGKNKDLPELGSFHSPADSFSMLEKNPPYTVQSSEERASMTTPSRRAPPIGSRVCVRMVLA